MNDIIFSYEGIKELCQKHFDEIKARVNLKDLKRVLIGRSVRFIDPTGKFGYAHFGDFYFDENGVMMLITKEREYTKYHRPDILSDTLWSTVPVIYAGVNTRFKDDRYQEIFTGDIVSINHNTSLVRYVHPTIPGLLGDNCDLQFREGLVLHKEGTVFSDISKDLYKNFDYYSLYWPGYQYSPNGIRTEEIIRRASTAFDAPTFLGEPPVINHGRRTVFDNIEDVLKDNDVLTYFISDEDYYVEDEEGNQTYELYIDINSFADNFKGEDYKIPIKQADELRNLHEYLKKPIADFLLYAHNHPDKMFVLCDFQESLSVVGFLKQKVAMLFHDWFLYGIHNVALPSWIMIQIANYECI